MSCILEIKWLFPSGAVEIVEGSGLFQSWSFLPLEGQSMDHSTKLWYRVILLIDDLSHVKGLNAKAKLVTKY